MAVALLAMVSCGNSENAEYIVINELMASNRTGLQKDNADPTDWIELKNTSTDSIDLKGFTLVVAKEAPNKDATDSSDGKKKDNDGDENNDDENKKEKKKHKKWSFPSIKIGAGQCLVVFAKKYNDSEPGQALQADLNLPKEGATVQLLAPNDRVISEVNYSGLEPDQALALQADSTYKITYWQSPGYENTRQGYESAIQTIDAQRKSPIRIWELMSRAPHSYENWVELKNVSDKPVDLSSYSLSKKMNRQEGWKLPAKTLAPGEIITVDLAGGKAKPGKSLQAPFKIGDNETVVLSRNGEFMDGLCAKLTPYGASIGRQSKAKGFFFFSIPSRDSDNGNTGKRYITEKPEWNQKPGIYKNQKSLCLKPARHGQSIHYTLDGSEPTMNSPLLKDSIVLTKPTVVRSFAEGDSTAMPSNIHTASYLIGVDHDLPVINISLNNNDFYSQSDGIYANGPGYGGDFPYMGANFWKDWTKKAHIELFDGKDGFASDCGLKIFGGYSRALPKKSLRIKFRGEFGDSKVHYDFFDTGQPIDIEDLVLRSGSQDYNRYMIRDEFFTSLAQPGSPSLLIQMYSPVALYINAEYFGLYYLREKINADFVARKLNLPKDSIDIHLSGPSKYMDLVNRISSLDMKKKENYEFAKNNIDLQGLIDYKIGNIYSGKWDTGNIRYTRSRHPDSDRKWRFVYYDIDASWSSSNSHGASFALSTSPDVLPEKKARHNVLINRMLTNNEFRQFFLQRLSYHLTNTYATKNTTAHFDKLIARIRPEMKRNCQRWPQMGYDAWEKNISEFRARLINRPQIILNEIRDYLKVTPEENKKYFAHLGY